MKKFQHFLNKSGIVYIHTYLKMYGYFLTVKVVEKWG